MTYQTAVQFVTLYYSSSKSNTGVHKYLPPGRLATKLCTVAPSICWCSEWNLLHVIFLAPEIVSWLVQIFGKFMGSCSRLQINLKCTQSVQFAQFINALISGRYACLWSRARNLNSDSEDPSSATETQNYSTCSKPVPFLSRTLQHFTQQTIPCVM
jgi:hypothetical protein